MVFACYRLAVMTFSMYWVTGQDVARETEKWAESAAVASSFLFFLCDILSSHPVTVIDSYMEKVMIAIWQLAITLAEDHRSANLNLVAVLP